jgi:histidinol-phosphate phosphatase family protein
VSGRPAAFLDRDGTLNQLVADASSGLPESPLHVADVRLLDGAVAGALALADAGLALVCVTNQPAAAKGTVSVEQLLLVHERVVALLREQGVQLDASRLCLHHPRAVVPELAGPCACRKPAPGMLFDAAKELGGRRHGCRCRSRPRGRRSHRAHHAAGKRPQARRRNEPGSRRGRSCRRRGAGPRRLLDIGLRPQTLGKPGRQSR